MELSGDIMFKVVSKLFLVLFTLNALAETKPTVVIKPATMKKIERSLLLPVVVKSKVSSLLVSDGNYIVEKKLVHLGQRIKKGQALLVLRNQDEAGLYEKRIIKAPVAGVVANINLDVGEFVGVKAELILINNPDQLYGKVEVAPSDYQKLKIGQKATLKFPGLNIDSVESKIIGVGKTINPQTGTVPIEVSLKLPSEKQILPGSIGNIRITLKSEDLLLVNEKSLYYIGEDVFLGTLNKDKKVKKVKVKLGKRIKDSIEILEGLSIGNEYITESPKFLRDGEEVLRKKEQ